LHWEVRLRRRPRRIAARPKRLWQQYEREIVSPIEVGLFAGAVDLEKYPFFVHLMVKLMKAETGNSRD